MTCCCEKCVIVGNYSFRKNKLKDVWCEKIVGGGTSTWDNNGYIEIDNYGGKPGTDIDKTCGHLLNLSEEQVRRKCNDKPKCKGYSLRKFGGNSNFRPWCLKEESEKLRIKVTTEKYYKRDSG